MLMLCSIDLKILLSKNKKHDTNEVVDGDTMLYQIGASHVNCNRVSPLPLIIK